MKNYLCIFVLISAIIFSCINSALIKEGCTDGIYLWYNSIIPILLPFMMLTGIIINIIRSMHISKYLAFAISLTIGLLCGFPTGTMIITFFFENNTLSRRDAQLLLPLCNNASPMFIIGYVHAMFIAETLPTHILIALIYLPQIACTAILFYASYIHQNYNSHIQAETITHSMQIRGVNEKHKLYSQNEAAVTISKNATTSKQTDDQSMMIRCITNITVIGIYISIFSIISAIICRYIPGITAHIVTSFLEISNGIQEISALNMPANIKTALTISLTSFGGLSAIFQSHDMIKSSGLSFIKYILCKSVFGIICYITSYAYMT